MKQELGLKKNFNLFLSLLVSIRHSHRNFLKQKFYAFPTIQQGQIFYVFEVMNEGYEFDCSCEFTLFAGISVPELAALLFAGHAVYCDFRLEPCFGDLV